jgi:acetolactate synthase-1/2/3 large subunit
VQLVELAQASTTAIPPARREWVSRLRLLAERHATWPAGKKPGDGIDFTEVVAALHRHATRDMLLCVDAGTFAAPVYRHFPFAPPQRLMAPLSGAMGYGVPAAVASQLRYPNRKVVCLVGDGGFLMTGNEMIAAVERQLPIVFVLSHNSAYGSIRIHQEKIYPGRHRGTTLFNPHFADVAKAFGMQSHRITDAGSVDQAVAAALAASEPVFLEVMSSLQAVLPQAEAGRLERDVA